MRVSSLRVTLLGSLLTGIVSACAHGGEDGRSASEHRAAAAQDELKASGEEQQYQANAPSASSYPGGMDPFGGATPNTLQVYNPTAGHLLAADRHLREAHQESKAAAALDSFEDQACLGESREVRRSCPLIRAKVERVEESPRGVRLHLFPAADGAEVLREMRCHLAYARTLAFKDVPPCPLYARGVTVELDAAAHVIEVRGDGAPGAEHVRRDARALFSPPSVAIGP
jgi:hypothetical protein